MRASWISLSTVITQTTTAAAMSPHTTTKTGPDAWRMSEIGSSLIGAPAAMGTAVGVIRLAYSTRVTSTLRSRAQPSSSVPVASKAPLESV